MNDDRNTEHGWKLVGPRKKFWHFFRRGTSLCASWALYNTAPPYLLLPPQEGLICKRCLQLFNAGPQLAHEMTASERLGRSEKIRKGVKVVDVIDVVDTAAKAYHTTEKMLADVVDVEEEVSGCWAETAGQDA